MTGEAITGYGSISRVLCSGDGAQADTRIEISFSESSFPNIFIDAEKSRVVIQADGMIEREEILGALKSVVKMLEA